MVVGKDLQQQHKRAVAWSRVFGNCELEGRTFEPRGSGTHLHSQLSGCSTTELKGEALLDQPQPVHDWLKVPEVLSLRAVTL